MSWEGKSHLLEKKAAWVVWVNEDLTEGRGFQKVLAVCEQESTAQRLAKGADVQRADGIVREVPIFRFQFSCLTLSSWRNSSSSCWYVPCGPGQLIKPTVEDKKEEARLAEKKARKARKEMALQKARDLGMDDEDIAALREASDI